MVPMRACTRHLLLLQRSHALVRGRASATFFGMLLVGLLARCSGGGSSSGGTTGPTAQATAGPGFVSIPPSVAVVGKTLTYDANATDAVSTTLIYTVTAGPAGLSIVPTTRIITWTPQAAQAGQQTVSITASNGPANTTQTFTLSVFGVGKELASVPITSTTGGNVEVSDPASSLNGLTLTFGPDALPGDTTIKVLEITGSSVSAGGQSSVVRGISIEPDGLVLNSPVTVTIPFSSADLNAHGGIVLPDFLGVFFLDPTTGRQVSQDSFRVDTVQNVLVGTLDHFSEYFWFPIGRLCPPPTPTETDCPTTYAPFQASQYLPALLVHGFLFDSNGGSIFGITNGQGDGKGTQGYWGKLQELLGPINRNTPDYIGVWRLDYNSRDVSFRKTAFLLAVALNKIASETKGSPVNIVAHSFGGILTRTYLQGMASVDFTGDPAGPFVPYVKGVNKLMTLGTPHQGIGSTVFGDSYSRIEADECAADSLLNRWRTCYDTATALPSPKDELLRALNEKPLPPLGGAPHAYNVIIGQEFKFGLVTQELQKDDGLISIEGADICSALRGGCPSSVVVTKMIPLCHARGGFAYCGWGVNLPMVPIDNEEHRLFPVIRAFLTTGSAPNLAPPPVVTSILTVSPPSHGTIKSDLGGIQCGTTCSATFEDGTSVTLSAVPDSGFTFAGWSDSCVNKAGPCKLVISGAAAVQATFTPKPVPIALQGTWSPTGSLTTARYWHAATLLPNGKVRVVGGYGNSGILTSAEEYDPAANGGVGAWRATGSLTNHRYRHTATLLPTGKVLVVGGSTDGVGGFLASAELFQ